MSAVASSSYSISALENLSGIGETPTSTRAVIENSSVDRTQDFVSSYLSRIACAPEADPSVLLEGFFGATVYKDGEPLFLRMELLSEKNSKAWKHFKDASAYIGTSGLLSDLASLAGKTEYPSYNEEIKDRTGFTEEEYVQFATRAMKRERADAKIAGVIRETGIGALAMQTYSSPEEPRYIVYVTKNPDFSIQNVQRPRFILKDYIESYQDILMAMGSDFTQNKSFHNRGIFKNPFWVFEKKYGGLSLLLHGFSAAVAARFFPEKKWMIVKPHWSMQSILKKNLLFGDGYVQEGSKRTDITIWTNEKFQDSSPNYINLWALLRIYCQYIFPYC